MQHHISVRLLIYQLGIAAVTLLIAVLHPYAQQVDETSHLHIAPLYGWLFFQSWTLGLPGFLIGSVVGTLHRRWGAALGGVLISCAPLLVLADILTFNWVGERFLSETTQHILTALLPGLVQFANGGLVLAALLIAATTLGVLLAVWKIAARVAHSVELPASGTQRISAIVVTVVILIGLVAAPMRRMSQTLAEMRAHSDRHPFCAALLVDYHGTGVAPPEGEERIHSQLTALCLADNIRRDRRRFDEIQAVGEAARPQNVLVVVVESWRHEMVDPAIMPNLHKFSQDALWCRNHFSTGNSTSTSMFSMFSGLESVWFERLRNESPLLPRLFSQAGYTTGFFGGNDSWHHFDMEGFINAKWFDEYHEFPIRWLSGDLEMIDRATRFLEPPTDDRADAGPRLAVLYLTLTHFDYDSDPSDRIFQPAAEGGFMSPYPRAKREQVWNRYKNSMRTADRLLAPLLRHDWMVVIAGDHGESFLEDGCCSHGVRISRYQNMTPAIVYSPNLPAAEITAPTMHADLLPTMLSAAGIETSDPGLFHGIDLSGEERDRPRTFLTRNCVVDEGVLIGPWSIDPSQPFGYRAFFSISDWQAAAANAVGEDGLMLSAGTHAAGIDPKADQLLRQWCADRFPISTPGWDEANIDLLAQHLSAPDVEVRLAAVSTAMQMDPNEEPQLLPLVKQATTDPNDRVRETAQQAVIELQRRAAD